MFLRLPSSVCIHKLSSRLDFLFSMTKKPQKIWNNFSFANKPITILWIILKQQNFAIYFTGQNICNIRSKSTSTNALNILFYKYWTMGFCWYILVLNFQPYTIISFQKVLLFLEQNFNVDHCLREEESNTRKMFLKTLGLSAMIFFSTLTNAM